jgi:Cdc6-like AAA superfamily ATPase
MRIIIIISFLSLVVLAGWAYFPTSEGLALFGQPDPAVLQARNNLSLDRIATLRITEAALQQRIESARDLWIYWQMGYFGAFVAVMACVCGVVCGAGVALSRRLSIHIAQIGNAIIPVHTEDIRNMTPVLATLASAELEKGASIRQQEAFGMARAMLSDMASLSKAIPKSISPTLPIGNEPLAALPTTPVKAFAVPTFAMMLSEGLIATGSPMVMGFDSANQPQLRKPKDIKTMAIAGWQGSGKTLSTAYLLTCAVYQYPDAHVYVVDPHRQHEESLTTLIQPLTGTGRVSLVNPVDVGAFLQEMMATLERRLSDQESSEKPIFIFIDEMAKLARSLPEPHFDLFIDFLAAVTEETRKVNIIFFGISQKWDARNFKNRKDIRASMPSLLVHKCKPSQAELLLEDTQERKLVKGLRLPGECLLATSHDADPQVVRMPLITPQDILAIATRLIDVTPATVATDNTPPAATANETARESGETSIATSATGETPITPEPIIDLDKARFLTQQMIDQGDETLSHLATVMGINKGSLFRFLKGDAPSQGVKAALFAYYAQHPETLVVTPETDTSEPEQAAETNVIPFPNSAVL